MCRQTQKQKIWNRADCFKCEQTSIVLKSELYVFYSQKISLTDDISNVYKYYKQGTKIIHIWHLSLDIEHLSLDIEHPTGIVSPF